MIGASSGIGEAVARRLAADGARVALVARSEDKLRRIAGEIDDLCGDVDGEARALAYAHDVAEVGEAPLLFERICRDLGGLDLVVYAAGAMHAVEPEEYDTEKDLEMLTVNLHGAVAWLNLAADRFTRLGGGTLVGIGSIAGDRGRVGNPVYNTSKAALDTYLEALRNRLSRHGVRVVTIKPGFVDTPMTHGLDGLFWLISADQAAKTIVAKAEKGATTAYVPARWRLVSWVIRSIPSFLFRRLKI